jgi:hypothetical protein
MGTNSWSRFLRTIGTAMLELAQELEAAQTDGQDQEQDEAHHARPQRAVPLPHVRGPRKQAILMVEGLNSDFGMTAGPIADAAGTDGFNVYEPLGKLELEGVLELVPGSRPRRWRLARRFRSNPNSPDEVA